LIRVNGGGEYSSREFPADRKRIDIGDYYADDSRIRAELGWRPTISLEDGVARSLAYYREHLLSYL
jgi:UDP-glucose 4-epimerase